MNGWSLKKIEELVDEEPISFENQYLTMKDTHYDNSTKKFQLEKAQIKNKQWVK